MKTHEIITLANRVNSAIDKVMDGLEGWTPEEMIVLFAGILVSLAEFHPETSASASQLKSPQSRPRSTTPHVVLVAALKMSMSNAGIGLIRIETKRMREALERIDDLGDKAQNLLDKLEMAAGLIDENGKRDDE